MKVRYGCNLMTRWTPVVGAARIVRQMAIVSYTVNWTSVFRDIPNMKYNISTHCKVIKSSSY